MRQRIGAGASAHYALRVEGHLDEHWSAWFGGLTLARQADGTTLLRGLVTDQADLHGLLAKVRDLGVTLLSVCHDDGAGSKLSPVTGLLHTDRLTLRPATADEADATWRFRRREDVSRWLTQAPSTPQEHRTLFAEPDRLARTLVIELGDEVIGDLMVKIEDAWAQTEVADGAARVQAELGWVLAPEHAGRGYATEAVRELIRHCFEDLKLRRVTANCFAANDASWRLMERVGMRRELYAVRESLHRSGEWLDGLGYALLADEWRVRHREQPLTG